jgi:hypothetical protein
MKVFAVALRLREIKANSYKTTLEGIDLADGEYTRSDPEMKRLAEISTHVEQVRVSVCAERSDEGPELLRRKSALEW